MPITTCTCDAFVTLCDVASFGFPAAWIRCAQTSIDALPEIAHHLVPELNN